jgi:hypothetical protein
MRWPIILALGLLGAIDIPDLAAAPAGEQAAAARQQAERLAKLPAVTPRTIGKTDASGRKQRGNASYYAPKFNHRKMADGRRLDTNANIAASKSLPLGSVAKVTNLVLSAFAPNMAAAVGKDRPTYAACKMASTAVARRKWSSRRRLAGTGWLWRVRRRRKARSSS